VVSKARLYHVCSDCFFERFTARRETGISFFEDVAHSGIEESPPLEYVR
jgi:hypothetical protein